MTSLLWSKMLMQAFEDYPPEQLEKMWEHKSYIMGAVLKTKPKAGGSNYPRHELTTTRSEKARVLRG